MQHKTLYRVILCGVTVVQETSRLGINISEQFKQRIKVTSGLGKLFIVIISLFFCCYVWIYHVFSIELSGSIFLESLDKAVGHPRYLYRIIQFAIYVYLEGLYFFPQERQLESLKFTKIVKRCFMSQSGSLQRHINKV